MVKCRAERLQGSQRMLVVPDRVLQSVDENQNEFAVSPGPERRMDNEAGGWDTVPEMQSMTNFFSRCPSAFSGAASVGLRSVLRSSAPAT